MLNLGCTNGSLDGEVNYSSPVPVIGVYIAAASLGCLLLMVYDVIFAGILLKKRWLPCKWFALNSVTLTLLSVAAKLTVDLTTPMPSRWDQLSKLTGSAFLCIGMGFIVPSIGVNSESECFTNMMALTILVITVTVNICIQLSTGVIFMFIVEHIIILGLMMLLLLMLWHISLKIKKIKRINAGAYTSLITRGSDSMFDRLKLCSVHAYCSNPQFIISMFPMNIAVGSLCAACTAIIIDAAFRSLIQNKLEFCEGFSNYSWSMPYIVIIQIVTALLGCIPIVARGVAMFCRMDLDLIILPFFQDKHHVKQMNRTLKAKGITLHRLLNLFGSILTRIVFIAQVFIVLPWLLLRCFPDSVKDDNQLEYYDEGVVFVAARRHSVRKSIDDMIRLMNPVSGSNSVYQPSLYLSRRSPSPYLCRNSMKIRDGGHMIEISALSMALLVKMAEASIPKSLLVTLVNTFKEAKEVIDYIYKAIQRHDIESREPQRDSEKWAYARAVWIGGDLSCMLPGHTEPSTDPMVAIDTITNLKVILRNGDVWEDLHRVIDFINSKSYLSIEELCEAIEQLFTDMLNALFAQLPNAIFQSISKTRGEEFEESVRVAIKLLFKIQSFQHQDDWAFPAGMTSIQSFQHQDDRRDFYRGQFQRLEDIALVRRDGGFMIMPETNMP